MSPDPARPDAAQTTATCPPVVVAWVQPDLEALTTDVTLAMRWTDAHLPVTPLAVPA